MCTPASLCNTMQHSALNMHTAVSLDSVMRCTLPCFNRWVTAPSVQCNDPASKSQMVLRSLLTWMSARELNRQWNASGEGLLDT